MQYAKSISSLLLPPLPPFSSFMALNAPPCTPLTCEPNPPPRPLYTPSTHANPAHSTPLPPLSFLSPSPFPHLSPPCPYTLLPLPIICRPHYPSPSRLPHLSLTLYPYNPSSLSSPSPSPLLPSPPYSLPLSLLLPLPYPTASLYRPSGRHYSPLLRSVRKGSWNCESAGCRAVHQKRGSYVRTRLTWQSEDRMNDTVRQCKRCYNITQLVLQIGRILCSVLVLPLKI